MASIQCSKCNQGIHYHSEANGIECRFISKENWASICNSRFDKTKLEMDATNSYPKLYRSDTIDEDFSSSIIKFWICPYCGSIIVFDDEGNVTDTFILSDEQPQLTDYTEGVIFDDFLWEEITDGCFPNYKLVDIIPSAFIKVNDTYIISIKDGKESVYKKLL